MLLRTSCFGVNSWKPSGSILIIFCGSRLFLMALVVWAMCFKSECCRNHPDTWSGGRFLNILGGDNLRCATNVLLVNDLFITNYSKRLRCPPSDMRHRVHLKHQNFISEFSKFRKKCQVPDDFICFFPRLDLDCKKHRKWVRKSPSPLFSKQGASSFG